MSTVEVSQTADLNGFPSHIVWTDRYSPENSAVPLIITSIPDMDSQLSPPLSEREVQDIEASEEEYSNEAATVYESTEELIEDLHSLREGSRRQNNE